MKILFASFSHVLFSLLDGVFSCWQDMLGGYLRVSRHLVVNEFDSFYFITCDILSRYIRTKALSYFL